jgi:hypothetical protein
MGKQDGIPNRKNRQGPLSLKYLGVLGFRTACGFGGLLGLRGALFLACFCHIIALSALETFIKLDNR